MKRVFKYVSRTLKLFLLYKNKKKINDLINLRDIHKGQECYIFGDGVSLKYFDLSVFSDKIAIGSNNLIFHKDFKKINIKYYSIYEPFWFLPYFVSGFKGVKFWKNKIQKYHSLKAKENIQITFFTDISNSIRFKGSNIFYVSNQIINDLTDVNFISHKINSFEGSLRAQITMAIFLGFKKAYLVGHDYTHEESLSRHFYENGIGKKNSFYKWNYEFLEKVKKEINLITITLKGSSSTLDSITYTEFFKKELIFKENHKIVSKEGLIALKSWPLYEI